MTAFPLLIACLLLGVVVARVAKTPPTLAAGLNWWVINIALPALVLHLIPQLHFTSDMWLLVVSQWLVFAVAWILFAVLGKALHWSSERIGALTLVCGLGNTAFIGYPMIEALRGQQGLVLAAVADQPGCFVMLAVGGAIVTSVYSGGRIHAGEIAKRVLLFPSFVALLVGTAMGVLGGWPVAVDSILNRVGDTLVPLALFSVGLQVRMQFTYEQLGATGLGLLYKLALAPLFVYGLGVASSIGGLTLTISVLQSAMAPMISAAILAEQHDLEPRLANLVLVTGIVLSFVTVPLINTLL
jgi:malate permease and related proteins